MRALERVVVVSWGRGPAHTRAYTPRASLPPSQEHVRYQYRMPRDLIAFYCRIVVRKWTQIRGSENGHRSSENGLMHSLCHHHHPLPPPRPLAHTPRALLPQEYGRAMYRTSRILITLHRRIVVRKRVHFGGRKTTRSNQGSSLFWGSENDPTSWDTRVA